MKSRRANIRVWGIGCLRALEARGLGSTPSTLNGRAVSPVVLLTRPIMTSLPPSVFLCFANTRRAITMPETLPPDDDDLDLDDLDEDDDDFDDLDLDDDDEFDEDDEDDDE